MKTFSWGTGAAVISGLGLHVAIGDQSYGVGSSPHAIARALLRPCTFGVGWGGLAALPYTGGRREGRGSGPPQTAEGTAPEAPEEILGAVLSR